MNINKLLRLFNKKEKKKLIVLFFMMILAAILETLGIGLIAPFVGVITNPVIIQEHALLASVYEWFNFQSTNAFIVFLVLVLLSVFVFKNLYLLLFNYLQVRVTTNQQVKLSRSLFSEYLIKPYTFHLQRNTADLLRNVNGEVTKVFQGIVISGFQLFTEILVILCISILLLITSPVALLTASILLGGSIFLFFKLQRNKIDQLGKEQQAVTGKMIKWVNQGLGASKEVKVSGKESFFINSYTEQSQRNASNIRYIKMLEIIPRFFIETLIVAIVLIVMLIIIFQGTNMSQLMSTMALFAMAAMRLMPSINRLVALITTIRYSLPALHVVYEDLFLDKKVNHVNNTIPVEINKGAKHYHNSIQLSKISFRYPGQKEYAINNVSLTIPIGQSVAFIGESGAGKTTLVDIILGLYSPENGRVFVDGKDLIDQKTIWQQKIGYIPQSIFLSDDTIRANVAFGMNSEQIDDTEVWRALEQAQLKEFVEALPDKLETAVGERGVRLSGGQRQRIGIARALYHNPEILFMDEATSALDNETEREIMKAIDGLKGEKTLIIIAHRLSTIENCDIVFTINKGELVSVKDNSSNGLTKDEDKIRLSI
ncbi:ABC transporter ATP-binding protein [Oceanobacillus piezotolerans]|uniref:ABC transporter ATP-binding protein n=1 Tax=Oceanobacillus piezotolerans TaxID=2448030 RepID=A0A498D9G8_9BACI|nr:ABC transporter ATP-binding protein [Oceanobacillus piezotolerans]RLL42946.1 ABC transporter ATP-binding protein [Oceanobacillus piezotolerans]